MPSRAELLFDKIVADHNPQWFVGKHVKIGFRTGELGGTHMEWMWVHVLVAQDGKCLGELENEPYFANYMHNGDKVTLWPYEVVEIGVEQEISGR